MAGNEAPISDDFSAPVSRDAQLSVYHSDSIQTGFRPNRDILSL